MARLLRSAPLAQVALLLLVLAAAACESASDDDAQDAAADAEPGSATADRDASPSAARDGAVGDARDDQPANEGADAATRTRDASSSDGATPARDAALDATQADAAHDTGRPDARVPGRDAAVGDGAAGQCGRPERVTAPFGCRFAWGTNDPTTSLPGLQRLGFVTKWVGYEVDKDGNLPRCDGCGWLSQFKTREQVPVYYAYFIGFLGSANGFADQNVNPNGPNLATDGAQLIRSQRDKLIDLYASYAAQSAHVLGDKPLVWLLEGDFVQYTYKEQKQALSMDELAVLARDITCAIKGHMPSAVVAINHTTWLSDELTNAFWEAMERAGVHYDLVWTTGVANNDGFFEKDAKPGHYNEATAKYAYVAKKTGRKILVDTSFGLSGMADSWASATPDVLNARIADGVLGANVTMPPSTYVSTTETLGKQLDAFCR